MHVKEYAGNLVKGSGVYPSKDMDRALKILARLVEVDVVEDESPAEILERIGRQVASMKEKARSWDALEGATKQLFDWEKPF